MSQPPLPVLPEYWTRAEDRSQAVNALFDRSARDYDWICRVTSFGSGQSYRRQALGRGGLAAGMTMLDAGTGTGLVAREAARLLGPEGRVIGLDPSMQMLLAGESALHMPRVQAVGERLPFADRSFDFVAMGYALRHTADLDLLFGEYRRVLKPGGRVLILEITCPESRVGAGLTELYFRHLVPFIARIGTGSEDAARLMRFYWDTIRHCVPPSIVLASLTRAGFSSARRDVVHGIFSEYSALAM